MNYSVIAPSPLGDFWGPKPYLAKQSLKLSLSN